VSGVSHAAPGLVAAIHFQLKRALLHLLTSDGSSFVAIEAPWDVSILDAKGQTTNAEEDKHSVIGTSQLTDRNEGLWKSLRNFTAAYVEGRISGDGCKFAICTNVAIDKGIASEFLNRTSEEDDAWVAKKVQSILKAGENPSDSISPHYIYLKQHPAEFANVVANLEVIDSSAESKDGETMQSIFKELRSTPEEQGYVLEALVGWVEERANESLKENKPAILSVAAFNTRYRDELNRGRQRRLLSRLQTDFDSAITPEQKNKHRADLFQHQLRWVGLDRSPDIMESAIEDFLRYDIAVTAYADIGEIPKERFQDREREIHSQWKQIFNRDTLDWKGSAAIERAKMGETVFHNSNALNVPLEGMNCDSYLTRGALHQLANGPEDEPLIGWHPEFRDFAKGQVAKKK